MSIRLRLDKDQVKSIRRMLALSADELTAVKQYWGQLATPPLRASELIEAARQCISSKRNEPIEASLCEDLVGQLLSFYTILRRSGSTANEIQAALNRSFQTSLDNDQIEKWKELEEGFFSLLQSKVVRLTAMTLELSYDYANLLRRSNIIADVRPLFDDTASEIEAAVVSYTLRLEYTASTESLDLSIALDQEDLLRLREQCDRALLKAATIERKMKSGLIAPTTIPGTESKKQA